MKALDLSIVILCSLLLFITNSHAQEDIDFKEWFVEAESYFLFEEYSDALPLYQRLLREDPENSNLKYKIGICYLNNPYHVKKASTFLLEATKNISESYKSNNFRERSAPPEVYFYLGQAYRVIGELNKALEYYRLFKKNINPDIFDIEVVDADIEACEVAKRMILHPVFNKKMNFGDVINSRFAERNPVISGDGNTIVFNRELQFYDAVFVSTKDHNGNWAPPYNLTPNFQLDGNSYCTGISYKGDEIFLYRSDNFDGNIYSSRLVNSQWQPLEKLNTLINTKYWESHASPSPDGEYLYFTSNRKGGYGGLDIYRSKKQSNGDWGMPVNLGPIVNSQYNEDSPFISPENNRLFFSSLGHKGMGGYDIFVSELVGPGVWSEPVNMGYPINTTSDDLFFCPVKGTNFTAVYAVYDPNTSLGLMDIYYTEVYNSVLPRIFTVKGSVNTPSPEIIGNESYTVSIIDSKQGKILDQTSIDSSGNFNLEVSQGEYQLLVDGKGINPVTIPVVLALRQEEGQIEIPVIQTKIADEEITKTQANITSLPEIDIIGNSYIITDSVPVIIKLRLETGNDLIVETYADAKLTNKEEYLIKKEDFIYSFNPNKGSNKLVFTSRNKKGSFNTKEVQVYYEPIEIAEPISNENIQPSVPASIKELATLSGTALGIFLESATSLEYRSLAELYTILLENDLENGYSEEDVSQLFAILLTQRNKSEYFNRAFQKKVSFNYIINKPGTNTYDYPIAVLRSNRPNTVDSLFQYQIDLIDLNPTDLENIDLLNYILSFSEIKSIGNEKSLAISSTNIINKLLDEQGSEKSAVMLEKASTTRELEQFYLNLLISADQELKSILAGIDFNILNINNSIDFVSYLYSEAKKGKISEISLISQIEKSILEEENNLNFFKETLANAATGELKLTIQQQETKEGNPEITGILESILKSVNTKEYSKAEVYDLLIRMIGIKDVEVFIEEMRKYSVKDLDSLLFVINKKHVSSPLEVIQYLLSESPYFDFTDSDINSLLIRMILEKGTEGKGLTRESFYSKKLTGKNRFITTVVLANILIIILLILFWRRRNKKK